ncbi:hypothetical protein D1R32_gp385 [Tunisvirus fontaine2]|uniref:F-box domain-containing protein n=1 Tax=Tunisvirus fontaine2 TaxID=1421067 RepID=V9SH74_9VIRU|nr:hypothetical protein D1R32_gp385 [Tunisvirus fontaine2]AHC55102.1 hypothetical protein TNS_ORF384 [Tunisvirus fontaine2]
MEGLPNELLVSIIGFLDAKDALMLSETCHLFRDIVLENAKIVQSRVSRKSLPFLERRVLAVISGECDFFEAIKEKSPFSGKILTCKKCEGKLFKGKKVGVWNEEAFAHGCRVYREKSVWVDGLVQYSHRRTFNSSETISLPSERRGKRVLVVAYTKVPGIFACNGEKYAIFKDRKRKNCSPCCKEHRGEMPALLF